MKKPHEHLNAKGRTTILVIRAQRVSFVAITPTLNRRWSMVSRETQKFETAKFYLR